MLESFNWVLPGLLAGSGRPGLLRKIDDDIRWIRKAGFRHVVSLTRQPLVHPEIDSFVVHHFPISDMGIPTPRRVLSLSQHILEDLERREPVLLHCKAGLGRTGTILACSLVSLGSTAEAAIRRIRTLSHFYIQTTGQEQFVRHYAEFLRAQASLGVLPDLFRAPADKTQGSRAP